MKIKTLTTSTLLALGLATFSASSTAAIASFDDLTLTAESSFQPGMDTTFTSGEATFATEWNETFNCCLSGFTYSNITDNTTAGFGNQYGNITGGGVNGSANFGISNPGSITSNVSFSGATTVTGAYFTNTTYAALSMLNGDDFAKQFVAGDFFTLTVNGLDNLGATISTMDISLADGTNILSDWLWSDMSGLGEVYGLDFSLSSSDVGDFGINTPAYFAIDDLTTVSAVPVPAAVWLFISGIVGLVGIARKR